MTISTPWAILLCKFKGDESTPLHPRSFYENLFTSTEAGTHSQANFFHSNSHRILDLTKSRIFPTTDGELFLEHSRDEFDKVVKARIEWLNDPKGVESPDSNYTFLRWAEEAATLHDRVYQKSTYPNSLE